MGGARIPMLSPMAVGIYELIVLQLMIHRSILLYRQWCRFLEQSNLRDLAGWFLAWHDKNRNNISVFDIVSPKLLNLYLPTAILKIYVILSKRGSHICTRWRMRTGIASHRGGRKILVETNIRYDIRVLAIDITSPPIDSDVLRLNLLFDWIRNIEILKLGSFWSRRNNEIIS